MSDSSSGRWGPPNVGAQSSDGFAPPTGPSFAAPSGSSAHDGPSLPRLPDTRDLSAPPIPAVAPGPAVAGPAVAELTFDAEDARPKRGRIAVAGTVVGVLALGAAGVFAASQFVGSDDGGATSPEAVGRAMMASIEREDVLGMVDLLLPGERETFREPAIDIVSELSRIEVLSTDASLADFAGLDFELSNETTQVTPTNARDISNITMRATMTATLQGESLPIGDLVTDLLGEGFDLGTLNERSDEIDFELPMTVVERDGVWYLSLFHTVAESIRNSEFAEPIPQRGIAPRGGDTPEGAIDVVLEGIEQLDLVKIIGAINPNEAEALQRYAPLFITDARLALDDVPLRWQVTDVEYAVEGSGSKRFIEITSLRIDGDVSGRSFSIAFADGCLVADAVDQHLDSCEGQQDLNLGDIMNESESVGRLIEEVQAAFADYEQPGITVQEVDGKWFVSPVGSGFDQMLAFMRAVDREEIDRIITRTQEVAADLTDVFARGLPNLALDPALGNDGNLLLDDLLDDLLEGAPGPSSGELTAGSGDSSGDASGEASGDGSNAGTGGGEPVLSDSELSEFETQQHIAGGCYDQAALADVVDCLTANIASGALPEYYLGIELQHPECGTGDIALGRLPLFQLSDEEYTAMITTASACFAGLIESGMVQEQDVPAEYLHPECGDGRNPWNLDALDAEGLFDDWLECVYS